MLELKDYAKSKGISYTTACAWVKNGKIKTEEGKKKVERWMKVRYVKED